MSDLPRPETPGPWMAAEGEESGMWYVPQPENTYSTVGVDDPGYVERDAKAIAALPDWIALADRQAALLTEAYELAEKIESTITTGTAEDALFDATRLKGLLYDALPDLDGEL